MKGRRRSVRSIKSQIIVLLLDNQKMSSKELSKELDRKSVTTMLWHLKKEGMIEHNGYSRWVLTDLGRKEAGILLGVMGRAEPCEVVKPARVEEEKAEEASPAESILLDPDGKWEIRYIDLVDRMFSLMEKMVKAQCSPRDTKTQNNE